MWTRDLPAEPLCLVPSARPAVLAETGMMCAVLLQRSVETATHPRHISSHVLGRQVGQIYAITLFSPNYILPTYRENAAVAVLKPSVCVCSPLAFSRQAYQTGEDNQNQVSPPIPAACNDVSRIQ
eukprot:COSAG02_NODE_1528_length_12089_cov_21.637698_8_plen_125_part_00